MEEGCLLVFLCHYFFSGPLLLENDSIFSHEILKISQTITKLIFFPVSPLVLEIIFAYFGVASSISWKLFNIFSLIFYKIFLTIFWWLPPFIFFHSLFPFPGANFKVFLGPYCVCYSISGDLLIFNFIKFCTDK